MTGFLPGESIGFSPYSLLHPDDVSSVVTVHNLCTYESDTIWFYTFANSFEVVHSFI